MKISPNYKLREIAGETIMVYQGVTEANLTRIIALNASAKLMWEKLLGKEFSLDEAADVLTVTYGIDKEQAMKDAAVWVDALKKCNVLED
jgi:hypothetical protein